MSEPTIKQGWVRALIFMPIWFLTMMIFVGLGTVAMMMIAGVDMTDTAAVEEWAMGMEGMGFASPMMLAMSLLQITASFAAIWFMMTVFNKEPLTNIGLSIKDRGQEMLVGLGAALLFIGGIFLILWILGAITVTGVVGLKPEVMMVSLMLFVAAFDEEIVFRGYVLNNLMDSMNRWWALGISSAVFA